MVLFTLAMTACNPTCTANPSSQKSDETTIAAYIATAGGITVIERGAVSEPADLTGYITAMVLTPDGTLYTNGSESRRVRDGRVTELPKRFDDVALAPDGKVWMVTSTDVTLLDGDAISTIATPERPRAMAIPNDGAIFLIAGNDLYRRDGHAWTKDDALKRLVGPNEALKGLAAGPGGELYLVTPTAVYRRDPTGLWRALSLGAHPEVFTFGQVSSKGHLPLAMRTGLHLIDATGAVRKLDIPVEPTRVNAIAIDDADRLWLGAVTGLHIVSLDGKPLQHWPAGTLPGRATRIAVHRQGPPLPASPPAPILGSARGTVLVDGQPLAHAKVELCTDSAHGDTQCGRASGPLYAMTDAAGAFTLNQVPRDTYSFFAYERDGKRAFAPSSWIITASEKSRRPCCNTLTAGDTWDLGTIKIP
ncbi:hypothetical protein [Chondromyces crocatus]|uniref:Uncharacterized protein n=1 Tax=Chondromyces crocatus TaxID=52 RepID=A0A0K1ECA6_CHOCO|nr:hypothetical protein [Chondromyces crocatus]AKT38516.1 uncharacterized protein CMC5_026630 [Chondromyces crocatus]